MPIYEFRCEKCESDFEQLFRSSSGDSVARCHRVFLLLATSFYKTIIFNPGKTFNKILQLVAILNHKQTCPHIVS